MNKIYIKNNNNEMSSTIYIDPWLKMSCYILWCLATHCLSLVDSLVLGMFFLDQFVSQLVDFSYTILMVLQILSTQAHMSVSLWVLASA